MINMSDAAVQEAKRLLEKQGKAGWGVRVGVQGGGCSGLSYKMHFAEAPDEKDKVFDHGGLKIWTDVKSYLYLNGLTLDFSNELIGGGFQFLNPNAKTTCSCGQSFNA
jgi:iron-sulfur cluster assembly protein